MSGPSLFICSGDVSGDIHASHLVRKLKQMVPDLHVWGVGGSKLEAEGVELIRHSHSMAVLGIVEVLKIIPELAKLRAQLVDEIQSRKPNAVLLVDYGGFNLSLARALRAQNQDIPIIYFISPQVWGSRPWRINTIARTITKMLVIFPFEEPLYQAKGVDATFVGHPLREKFDQLGLPENARELICERYKLDAGKPIIAVFPGSRKQEIRDFIPLLVDSVRWMQRERPDAQFALSQANERIAETIYEAMQKTGKTHMLGTTLKIIPQEDNYLLMRAADIVWAKSGTTTLETALLEKPMLVFYRGNWLSFVLFLAFKTVKYVAWPNLLAGKMLVPELIQLDCRAEQLVRYTRDWLDVPGATRDISEQLGAIRRHLGKGDFAENAALEVAKFLLVQRISEGDIERVAH